MYFVLSLVNLPYLLGRSKIPHLDEPIENIEREITRLMTKEIINLTVRIGVKTK